MLRLYPSGNCRVLQLLDQVLLLSTYSGPVKPEGLEGNNWKHVGWARCWQLCGHQRVVRSPGKASGWVGAAISLPTQKTEGPLWFFPSFLGLWMESSLPTSWRASWSCLKGQALEILLRGRELPLSSVLPAQALCNLKIPPAVCLLCVLHNQLFAKSSQTLFPWIFIERGTLWQQKWRGHGFSCLLQA